MKPSAHRQRFGTRTRVRRYSLLLSFVALTGGLFAAEWWLYETERNAFHRHLTSLAESYSKVLADPVWNRDDRRLTTILNALTADPAVQTAEINHRIDGGVDQAQQSSVVHPWEIQRSIQFQSDMAPMDIGTFTLLGDDRELVVQHLT